MVTVKQTGRTWSVFVDGKLVEGGFFTRRAAEECAEELRRDQEDQEDMGRYQSGYRVYRDGSYREDFGTDR